MDTARLVLLSGIRRGELFALRWRTVNEQVRCLMIREGVYEGKFDTPKTEASIRDVPLSEAVMHLLAEWRARVTCRSKSIS